MYREKEVMYTVYQHRNLSNGKSYIGMTSLEPKKRWNYGWGYQNQPKIWSDIKESDWNKDWEHNILGKFEDKQEALNVEEMFIWLFDSINGGYNTSSYGGTSYKRTEETKRKMSDNHADLSGEKHPFYGKHHSEETRNMISNSKGVNGILQFSKDGDFIAEYSSTHEAERQTGCYQTHICQCCKGKRKTAHGMKFSYCNGEQ